MAPIRTWPRLGDEPSCTPPGSQPIASGMAVAGLMLWADTWRVAHRQSD